MWSNLTQNDFDLVKNSILYAPLKSRLEWFAAAEKEVWVDSSFDVKSRSFSSRVFKITRVSKNYNAPSRHICKLCSTLFLENNEKAKFEFLI